MKEYVILKAKSRDEWLELRGEGIGSSEVGTIFGVNPFETVYQLWCRKKGLIPPVEENEAMRAGHILEGAVAQYFEEETGRKVIKSSKGDWIAYDLCRPFMRVSPDRTYWLTDSKKDGKGILECKTTQMDIDPDDLPKHWYLQLQYQLGVMRLKQGTLAWLTRGRKFGYVDIVFDENLYALIVEKLTDFWEKNIQQGIEPNVKTVSDVKIKYPSSDPEKLVVADDNVRDTMFSLFSVRAQIDELTSQKDELEDTLKMYMKDAEGLCLNGSDDIMITWKTGKDGSKFDEKRFKAEHPELYADYQVLKPGSRIFRVKK